MILGALFGLLVVTSGPTSSALWPTPVPVSDPLTVIMCGAILGESFDRTRGRLGEPSSAKTKAEQIVGWVYRVDGGRAECTLKVAQTRVVEIFVSSVNGQPDPAMVDPYGVALGTSDYDLVAKRGTARFGGDGDDENDEPVYPSQSGACWSYVFGPGQGKKDLTVTGIRVYLDLGNPSLDCFTR